MEFPQHGIKSLILQSTLRCPLQCAHCCTDSNPKRTERIPLSKLIELIDEAAENGISTIGFTGGDPFLLGEELVVCIERVLANKMDAIVISSAFWATSQDRAIQILRPFSNIYMLGLSTDKYHEEFVPLDNIRNAVKAAREIGIRRIEVQVTAFDEQEAVEIERKLGKDAEGVIFRSQSLWPIGQAAPFSKGQEQYLKSINDLDLACPMGAPMAGASGQLIGCCSALLNLGEDNPIILGDLNTDSLTSLLNGAGSNPYYTFLKTFGLRPLVEQLDRDGVLKADTLKAMDVCHLCYELHNEPEIKLKLHTFVCGELVAT